MPNENHWHTGDESPPRDGDYIAIPDHPYGCEAPHANWKTTEIAALKRLYPAAPREEIMQIINRSWMRIRDKANSIGLTRDRSLHPSKWSNDELQILKQHYPVSGSLGVMKALTNNGFARSQLACQRMAKNLKIKRIEIVWTEEELMILKDHYPNGGYRAVKALLPSRTRFAVTFKASQLGLKSGKEIKKWTEEEIAVLSRLYKKIPLKALQVHLPNRTPEAIMERHRRLTQEEIQW